MKKSTLSILLLVSVLISCNQKTTKESSTKTKTYQGYGEAIDSKKSVSAREISNLLTSVDSLDVKLSGTILKTCAAKGCWMKVDTGNGESMRVTFKDYGFFVPKEGVEGKTAVLQGRAYKTITAIEDLRHFAKDGGASEEELAKITEPKSEITFVAEGVLIGS